MKLHSINNNTFSNIYMSMMRINASCSERQFAYCYMLGNIWDNSFLV